MNNETLPFTEEERTFLIQNHAWEDPGPIYTNLPHGKGHSTKRKVFTAKHTATRKAHRRMNKRTNKH